MAAFAHLLSWFVPEPCFSPEERARARTLVMGCFGMAVMLAATSSVHEALSSGLLPQSAAGALSATLFSLPFALRLCGNLTLVASLGAATVAVGPWVGAFDSGLGVHAPMMLVTAGTPVLAAAFVGRIGALVCCAVSLLTIACAEWLIPGQARAAADSPMPSALVAIGLSALSALSGYFSWLFELERTRAQQHAEEGEARFRRLAEEAHDIVFRLHIAPRLALEYVNAAFERTLGYPKHAAQRDVRAFAERVVHAEDLAAVVQAGSSGFDEPIVGRVRRQDGTELWLEAKLVTTRGARGTVVLEGICRDVTAQKEKELELAHEATHDPLTGLLNRRAFEQQLETGDAPQKGRSHGLLYIDLDRFKEVNDTHGHELGDGLLRAVARRIARAIRDEDRLFRLGGDEFVVLVPPTTDEAMATAIGHRILQALDKPFWVEGVKLEARASVGMALGTMHGATPLEVVEAADRAMYRAKRQGGGMLCTAPHVMMSSGVRVTPIGLPAERPSRADQA
jgi:diguanylate cyclase (GGDEF)-like protein/PAS domain S-box-containing protein